jgi:hypothetical protein
VHIFLKAISPIHQSFQSIAATRPALAWALVRSPRQCAEQANRSPSSALVWALDPTIRQCGRNWRALLDKTPDFRSMVGFTSEEFPECLFLRHSGMAAMRQCEAKQQVKSTHRDLISVG